MSKKLVLRAPEKTRTSQKYPLRYTRELDDVLNDDYGDVQIEEQMPWIVKAIGKARLLIVNMKVELAGRFKLQVQLPKIVWFALLSAAPLIWAAVVKLLHR
jgi:hypothetical protein